MKLQVGKCYALTSDNKTKKFRVIKNITGTQIIIKDCETGAEEEFFTETAHGGFSDDFTIVEFDCMECDGKPSL
jgi:hypothetical protein